MKKTERLEKPFWLNKKVDLTLCMGIKRKLRRFNLHTVCEESLCPNMTECFSRGTATFMILGDVCTRNCGFCGVTKGVPVKPDDDEPARVAAAVKDMGLEYVVITSPTRDDLSDGGADFFCRTVGLIKRLSGDIKVEVLIPDFKGDEVAIEAVALSGCDVLGHNIETVERLYPLARSGADYRRSLQLLQYAKMVKPTVFTKSSVMLGLGEQIEEVKDIMLALRSVNCDFFTAGQYLAPTRHIYKVREYIAESVFAYLEKYAYSVGFNVAKCAPYVRSSYLADSFIPK